MDDIRKHPSQLLPTELGLLGFGAVMIVTLVSRIPAMGREGPGAVPSLSAATVGRHSCRRTKLCEERR